MGLVYPETGFTAEERRGEAGYVCGHLLQVSRELYHAISRISDFELLGSSFVSKFVKANRACLVPERSVASSVQPTFHLHDEMMRLLELAPYESGERRNHGVYDRGLSAAY
jgi:hypothetical protein